MVNTHCTLKGNIEEVMFQMDLLSELFAGWREAFKAIGEVPEELKEPEVCLTITDSDSESRLVARVIVGKR